MSRGKTIKRRISKRRTLKKYRKKQKGGSKILDLLKKKATAFGTTLGVVSPYPGWSYISGDDGNHIHTSSVYIFLDVGNVSIENRPNVLAFPISEYSKGINNYIYKGTEKIESLNDIVDSVKHPNVDLFNYPSQTETKVKYIYLAKN